MIRREDIPESFNLATHFLDRNVEEGRGDRVALYCPGPLTYAELARLTNRIGNVLLDLGVRSGDRVLLALSDGPEFVAAWYAALKIGAVVAEVYTFLQPKDYAYYVEYSGAHVVVADATTVDKLPPAQVLLVGETTFDGVSDELDPAPTRRDDVAIWKFTTGSTGAPKAAVHTAASPLVSFECYARDVVGFREDDVVLPVPKLFFGYARDMTALFTFGVGAAGIVFPERTTPELLFDLIERHRPTIMVQVPTMMSAMLEHPGAAERDLSSLRLVVSSGEALPPEVHRRWLDAYGGEVLPGVGSSELYHIYLSNRPGRVRPGSVGEPVPGYEAELDETGELWVRGDSAALGYRDDEEKSARTFVEGRVRTGDLFERDADGFYWYRGRADDLLKVGGIWVAPLEVENCLVAHPAVAECAIVGYEERGLTLPRAYVVARYPVDADELQDFVRARLSPHKYPRDVRFVDELPKTPSGKVDRRALAA